MLTDDTAAVLREQLRDAFKKFKEGFYPISVCTASEDSVGMVTAAVGSKLLGYRSMVLSAEVIFNQKGSMHDTKFTVQIVPNPDFESHLFSLYKQDPYRDILRFMEGFSRQTLELEVKAFVLGLHALDELRGRIADLEWQVKELAKASNRDKKKASYLGRAKATR